MTDFYFSSAANKKGKKTIKINSRTILFLLQILTITMHIIHRLITPIFSRFIFLDFIFGVFTRINLFPNNEACIKRKVIINGPKKSYRNEIKENLRYIGL